MALLGNYGTGLRLKRDINRYLAAEDPCGTAASCAGIEGGALRGDVDSEMIVSLLEWTVERSEDALLTEELDRDYSIERESLGKRPPDGWTPLSGCCKARSVILDQRSESIECSQSPLIVR